jgi:hypothetical protein
MRNMRTDLAEELGKLGEFFFYEIKTDEKTMAPIFKFLHKKTKNEYYYRPSYTDIADFGPGIVEMINELKMLIREDKLNKLGI